MFRHAKLCEFNTAIWVHKYGGPSDVSSTWKAQRFMDDNEYLLTNEWIKPKLSAKTGKEGC